MKNILTELTEDCAIIIKDEEHSRRVQKILFSLGAKWACYDQVVSFTDKEVLYVRKSANFGGAWIITYSSKNTFMLYSINKIKILELQDALVYNDHKFIEIGGKFYHLDQVVDAVKALETVDV